MGIRFGIWILVFGIVGHYYAQGKAQFDKTVNSLTADDTVENIQSHVDRTNRNPHGSPPEGNVYVEELKRVKQKLTEILQTLDNRLERLKISSTMTDVKAVQKLFKTKDREFKSTLREARICAENVRKTVPSTPPDTFQNELQQKLENLKARARIVDDLKKIAENTLGTKKALTNFKDSLANYSESLKKEVAQATKDVQDSKRRSAGSK